MKILAHAVCVIYLKWRCKHTLHDIDILYTYAKYLYLKKTNRIYISFIVYNTVKLLKERNIFFRSSIY